MDWIGSTIWHQHKPFLHPCFVPLTFQSYLAIVMALAPVQENNSDNPSIMFSNL